MANQTTAKNQQTQHSHAANSANTTTGAAFVAAPAKTQQNVTEIDLVEVFFTLVNNWKALVLGILIGAVILGAYHTLSIKPSYRATTQLYITSNDSVISLSDLQMGTALAEDYKKIITSRAVLNQVIQDLNLDMDYRALGNLITVNNPNNTHIIETNVTTSDLVMSRDIANDLLSASINQIYQVVGTNEPSIIDYSQAESVVDATPGLGRNVLIGGILGFVLVAAVLIIRMISNTTLRTDDDIEKYLKLPVLSAVPYFEE